MLLKTSLTVIVIVACAGSIFGQSRVIPVCPKPTDAEKLIGFEIKFVVPKDLETKQGNDIDYEYWGIVFGSEKDHSQLLAFKGLNVGNGEPSRDEITTSRKLTRRYWRHNKRRGTDSSGTFKNGKRWRNFGQFGEVIWYHNVSADAAAYFDSLIATACFVN